ncbi:hypothetical protein [Roseivirga pacifica]|uniref:hypothetical protein n=1 Tax=Roseivirga pacifica TaxID=1267423 RepID=UPI003BAFF3E9
MKKVIKKLIFTAIALFVIGNMSFAQKCLSSPVSIIGPTSVDVYGGSVLYRTQPVCNAIEYQWVLNLNSTTYTQVSQSNSHPNVSVTVGPNDWNFDIPIFSCGTRTISVRALVNDTGVPYYTNYVTMTVELTGCS